MTVDDHALVQAAVAGDRAAMDRLLRLHYDRIFAVCRRITGSDADAADAAQEALISIVRSMNRFDGRSSFGTWAYRIATNASLDELRRRRRRPMLSQHDAGGNGNANGNANGQADDNRFVDHEAGPRVEAIVDRLALDAALAEVPEVFRIPLVMRDVGDLDYAEIAEALDTPIGTIKSRIARGRAALAASLRSGNQDDPGQRPTTAP